MKMTFATRYFGSKKTVFSQAGQKTRTKQSEADSADINKIMERFNRSGKLPIMQRLPPNYGDSRVCDYQTALQIIIDAENSFKTLPAKVRKEFGNSPQNFVEAISDANKEPSGDISAKLSKLGILVKKEVSASDMLKGIYENTKKEPEKGVAN